jgi:glutathione S-transferase
MIYDLYGQFGKIIKWAEESQQKKAGGSAKRQLPGHTLYHFWGSYYSRITRKEVYKLGLEMPFKDTLLDKQAYQDLVKLGGQDLVPCLRIESKDGTVRWMYESKNIIEYLKTARQ